MWGVVEAWNLCYIGQSSLKNQGSTPPQVIGFLKHFLMLLWGRSVTGRINSKKLGCIPNLWSWWELEIEGLCPFHSQQTHHTTLSLQNSPLLLLLVFRPSLLLLLLQKNSHAEFHQVCFLIPWIVVATSVEEWRIMYWWERDLDLEMVVVVVVPAVPRFYVRAHD